MGGALGGGAALLLRKLRNAAENLLKHLAQRVEVRVLGLRPTVAFLGKNFDHLKPRPEDESLKPTYRTVTYIPKVGSRVNHRLLAARTEATLCRIKHDFPYDVILCSWIYPDVCGVARLLPRLQVPMVGISQGSDVHQYLNMRFRRKLIVDTLSKISGTITRSKDLRDRLVAAGVPATKVCPIYNGVNTGLFKAGDQLVARRALGLPESLVGRHPFPGPGLAIRCPGPISGENLAILRRADTIYMDEIRKAGLYDIIWQAFAALLPVRTVGVMGDQRTYDYICALRAVTSTDGMTADYYPFEHDFLANVSTRIINEVRGINRVVYGVTSKPPGTIELE